jgi:circadian clock protein KaiB
VVTIQKKTSDSTEAIERAKAEQPQSTYVLRLYVAGTTPASVRAVANIKHICEEHLQGRYELEVIDLYQQPTWLKESRSSLHPR